MWFCVCVGGGVWGCFRELLGVLNKGDPSCDRVSGKRTGWEVCVPGQ